MIETIQSIELKKTARELVENSSTVSHQDYISKAPRPYMYISIFTVWMASLVWFGPRLWGLLDMAYSIPSFLVMAAFIFFIGFAWLYGFYNVGIIVFAHIHKYFIKKPERIFVNQELLQQPHVAILYTTCNDFVEESLISCINQEYVNFKVYILDDSTDSVIKEKIDRFHSRFSHITQVIRRNDRIGYKAGNMNHALENYCHEPYFAIADADEILPPDFLLKLVPVIESDEMCGFVQANHRANTETKSELSNSLGVGVDIHWRYYQPLRNDFGFVMFLGHGALLRRKCWEEIEGFPNIVSEDLGFAIHARELGYRGRFVEDVICLEDFPDTVRSFRIRHIKWTRGTCEFLSKKFTWLIKAKNISWTEKLDVLFPTLNLPLTLVYFSFMVIANLFLPFYFGHAQDMTIEIGSSSFILPIFTLSQGFEAIYTLDFFLITIMTFFAPVLCFVVGLYKTPFKLLRFISHSTAMYAALGTLSSIGVISYLVSGKATFLVTGDKKQDGNTSIAISRNKSFNIRKNWRQFIEKSHPDTLVVQGLEFTIGLVFAVASIFMFQISFLGLCLAFMLMPILHHIGWKSKITRVLAHLPFFMILTGIFLAGLSLVGLQTIFFGFGFHF